MHVLYFLWNYTQCIVVSRNNRTKRVTSCRCLDGHVTKCLWRWEPDRSYNFSPPAHLCRYITAGSAFSVRAATLPVTPSFRKWDSTNNPKTKPSPSNPLLNIIAHAGVNFSCHLWHTWGYGGPILLNLGSSRGPLRDRGGLLKGSIKGWLGPCVCLEL